MATRKANQDVNQEIVTRVESNQKYQKIPKILLLLGSTTVNHSYYSVQQQKRKNCGVFDVELRDVLN